MPRPKPGFHPVSSAELRTLPAPPHWPRQSTATEDRLRPWAPRESGGECPVDGRNLLRACEGMNRFYRTCRKPPARSSLMMFANPVQLGKSTFAGTNQIRDDRRPEVSLRRGLLGGAGLHTLRGPFRNTLRATHLNGRIS